MNKFCIKTLVVAALCIASNQLIAIMPAIEPYKVYIENHYGAPIKFKIALPQESAQETSVGNLERVLVGDGYKVKKLSIRTTGVGSSYLSPFTDLAKELQQVHNQSNLDVNLYKNAVIIIKPSKSYENWSIQINWEGKTSTQEMSPEEQLITEIMNGKWESDCAQKVVDISSYPYYDWANKVGGKPNLNALLIAYVRTFLIDNDKAKLIATIDLLHKQLKDYDNLFADTKKNRN